MCASQGPLDLLLDENVMTKTNSDPSIESDGINVFVVYNGVRIAKRGHPNSPQAGTWVSLEPGYRVYDRDYPAKLVIERDGEIVSQ